MEKSTADDTDFEQLLKEATEDDVVLGANTTLMTGRFTVGSRLGSGGMGVVYEATDHEHNTTVALKVLSEASPGGIYRLKQEFRALANLVHPNLVVLHELFYDGNLWFFTMDLVVGKPLIDHLNVDYDLDQIRRVFLELAEGIGAIHDAGKLHRDLKPHNVLVTPRGHVTILDFGLVSDQEVGGVGQTILTDGLSGTPTYMAPEQAGLKPSLPASDWYAFGAMLFEALTGRPPFEDEARQVVERKQSEAAPSPCSVSPGIPKDLDELCQGLLQRDPENRPGYNEIVKVLGEASADAIVPNRFEETPFIGRRRELADLHAAFEITDGGRPAVVFVQGPSGIGKSRLIEHFLQEVEERRNSVLLKGRCYERESVPYKACDSLIDDLTRYLRRLPEKHAARLMPRHVASLAKIFPVLNRTEVVRQTRERHRLPPNPNELRRMAFHAAKELLSRISSQEPLILYVDDLQWSDADGVKLLSTLVSPPESPSLLLIGAFRSEDAEASIGVNMLRERLEKSGGAEVRDIHLGQLSKAEGLELAGELLSTDTGGLAAQIAKEANGNPFFICELARFADKEPLSTDKARLSAAIAHRVAGLQRFVRKLLRLIAVSGRPTSEKFLESAVNRSNISGPLKILETHRLIRQTGGSDNRVACYHDRIREAVLSEMSEDRIRKYHARLASTLEIEKIPDPIALTEHLLGAGELRKAGRIAAKAAKLSAETLAFENAARFYRTALDHAPGNREEERRLQAALGDALANGGHGADAANAYMSAAQDASSEEALTLRCLAAQQWINTGHMNEGTRELDRVMKAVGLRLHTQPAASVAILIANRLLLRSELRKIGKNPPRAIPQKKALELRACEAAMSGLWAADTVQSAAFCTRFLRLAIRQGSMTAMVRGLAAEAAYRATEGARAHAFSDRLMDQALALGKDETDPETRAYLKLAMGLACYSKGQLPESVTHLEEAETSCLEECQSRRRSTLEMTQAFLGAAYARLGLWNALQLKWDRWVGSAAELGNLHHLAVCRTWYMGCARWLAADQPERARRLMEKGLVEWPWPHFDLQRSHSLASRAYIHLYEGDARAAFAVSSELADRLYRSSMARIELLRIFFGIDHASCAIALAARDKVNGDGLRVAQRQIERLRREKPAIASPFIAYFQGAIACITGKEAQGIAHLRKAIGAFEESRYLLNAAAVKRRLGTLLGGDEGGALVEEGNRTMAEERIVDMDGVTGILAPGL